MDQDVLVEVPVEDGARLLDRLVRDGFDVSAAAWVKTYDDGRPYLYIATSEVDGRDVRDGYRAIQSVTRSSPGYGVDLAEIKLIRPSESLALGISETSRRPPYRSGGWFRGTNLGGEGIDGPAYLYPPVPVPAGS